ncbi:MAG TPA: fumarylacetoacetase [Thermoanaerobaculia bacterium]|nr:fumarylacetoacetase [Thermoanaerobaculia bacterium]
MTSDFPIENLPFGVARVNGERHICTILHDEVLDLHAAAADLDEPTLKEPVLNAFAAKRNTRVVKARMRSIIARIPRIANAEMLLPVDIGDYTDFYASVHHATNVGSMFRPDNPLLPNYKWVPIGYHGRSSSIVVSGTPVKRPSGQLKDDGDPFVGKTKRLDYEMELGIVIGAGNAMGESIAAADALDHVFGFCLVNDWSARDVQTWEYQPLGPFLAKNFATSISPWIVTVDALEPYRTKAAPRAEGDPQPLPYLDDDTAFDITVEVWLRAKSMSEPVRLSRGNFRDMYWTVAQLVAHHTVNGCNLRPGDLLASGTISGPDKDARGCLLELTWRGTEPIQLPNGETRRFLEDGDEVILRGYCERPGLPRIGFGECKGVVIG